MRNYHSIFTGASFLFVTPEIGGLPESLYSRAVFNIGFETGYVFKIYFFDCQFSFVIYCTGVSGKQKHVIFLVDLSIFTDIKIPCDLRFSYFYFCLNGCLPPYHVLLLMNLLLPQCSSPGSALLPGGELADEVCMLFIGQEIMFLSTLTKLKNQVRIWIWVMDLSFEDNKFKFFVFKHNQD